MHTTDSMPQRSGTDKQRLEGRVDPGLIAKFVEYKRGRKIGHLRFTSHEVEQSRFALCYPQHH